MRILHIRTGLAIEVERPLPAEVDVLVAVVVQVEVHDRADADLPGDLVLVGQVRALLLDDLACLLDGLVQQVLEVDDIALARGERTALVGDHAEGDVLHALVPVVAHELDDLEQLLEVQVLLIGDDVEALVEVILVVAVERGGEVAGDVERRAVAAQHDRRRHAVVIQHDDLRTLRFGEQALLAQLIDDGLHLVVVEALSRVGIERHAQQVIDALGILERDLLEPGEDLHGLGVAVLDPLEPGAALVLERRVLLRLLMEADVQIDHRLHAALLDLLAAAPLLVGADHLAELGAPVAEVVDAHGGVAVEVVDAAEAVADHRGGQVADVEALGDVDGRVVEAHGLALAHVAGAPAAGMGQHGFDDAAGHVAARGEHVQVAADDLHTVDLLARDLRRQRRRDDRRGLAQGLREPEAGQRIVAHLLLRRDLQHRRHARGVKAAISKARRSRIGDASGDDLLHIHQGFLSSCNQFHPIVTEPRAHGKTAA